MCVDTVKQEKTKGTTLKVIQVRLGYSDFPATNTYSHLDANSKESSLNILAGDVNTWVPKGFLAITQKNKILAFVKNPIKWRSR